MIRRRPLLPALLALAATRPAGAVEGRLVTVGGAITETVFALGAGRHVVAVDLTSQFPAPVQALPRVGYMRALAPEGLISLNPDLLLCSEEAGPPQAIAVLRAARTRVTIVPDAAGIEAVRRKIEVIAAAVDTDGAPLAETVTQDWRMLDVPIAALRPVRALFVLSASRGAPVVSGRGTHADAMLRAAGAVNVVDAFPGYRPLSAEMAAQLAPEVVIMMEHALAEAGTVDAVLSVPALAVTPAATSRRLVAIDAAYMLSFGPRAAHARRDLARMLHPRAALPDPPARPWT